MFLKISYLEFSLLSCSVDQNHLCNFGRGLYGEHSCETNLKSEPVVKEEMSFKEKVYG